MKNLNCMCEKSMAYHILLRFYLSYVGLLLLLFIMPQQVQAIAYAGAKATAIVGIIGNQYSNYNVPEDTLIHDKYGEGNWMGQSYTINSYPSKDYSGDIFASIFISAVAGSGYPDVSWGTAKAGGIMNFNNDNTINPQYFRIVGNWSWGIQADTSIIDEFAKATISINILLDGEYLLPDTTILAGSIQSDSGNLPMINPLSNKDEFSFSKPLEKGPHTLKIIIEGEVIAIPEPATLPLMISGIIAYWLQGRKAVRRNHGRVPPNDEKGKSHESPALFLCPPA